MTRIIFILFFILSKPLFCQTTFIVDNFSKDYFGKLFISDTTEVFSKGWIAIFDKKNKKQLIKVESDELTFSLHDGKVLANIKELPYGEQSQIIYEDFNFDGIEDFAIMDGQNSCYHGPSFKIYLATNNGFRYDEDFTKLSQNYCGMFSVDPDSKKIYTMLKDGCCWHEFSEFTIINNKPKIVATLTEEQSTPFYITTEETWNGTSMDKKTIKTMDINQEGIEIILSFTIAKNDKKMTLFNINDRMLYYALETKDGIVEFSYPLEAIYKSPDFKFDKSSNNLGVTFNSGTVKYKVYERPNEIGILIYVDGKTYNWIGDLKTKKGSLNKLLKVKLDNVY